MLVYRVRTMWTVNRANSEGWPLHHQFIKKIHRKDSCQNMHIYLCCKTGDTRTNSQINCTFKSTSINAFINHHPGHKATRLIPFRAPLDRCARISDTIGKRGMRPVLLLADLISKCYLAVLLLNSCMSFSNIRWGWNTSRDISFLTRNVIFVWKLMALKRGESQFSKLYIIKLCFIFI